MARHIWSVVSQAQIVDKLTNSVSIFNAIEALTPPKLPIEAPPLWIGSLWLGEPGSEMDPMRIRVLYPDGSEAESLELDRARFGSNGRLRQQAILGGFKITMPGRYEYVIEHRPASEWMAVASVPVDVQLASREEVRAMIDERMKTANRESN